MGSSRRRPRHLRGLHTEANRLSWFNPSTAHQCLCRSVAFHDSTAPGRRAQSVPNATVGQRLKPTHMRATSRLTAADARRLAAALLDAADVLNGIMR